MHYIPQEVEEAACATASAEAEEEEEAGLTFGTITDTSPEVLAAEAGLTLREFYEARAQVDSE